MERPTSSARWPLAPHHRAIVCNGADHYQIVTGEPYPRCGGRYGKPLTDLERIAPCNGVICALSFHPIKAPPWKRDSAVTPPWERV